MANGDIEQQLQAQMAGLNAPPQSAPAPPASRRVSGLDSMVNAFSNIQDPLARSLAKGLVETEISKAVGFKFTIPDPEDLEMIAAQKQIQLNEMRRQLAKDTVENVKAMFADATPQQQREWGIAGQDVDTLLESNPDLFVAATQRLPGMQDFKKSQLILAGTEDTDTASAGPAYQQKQAEAQAKSLSTQAGAIESATKVAKAKEKGGVFDEQAKGILSAIGEATGVDYEPFFSNPLSSDKGAIGFADAMGAAGRTGAAFAPSVSAALISAKADDIGDVFEDAAVTPDGLIQVQPGKGEAEKATQMYTALALYQAAKIQGKNISDLILEIPDLAEKGVGFDEGALEAAIQSEMKRLGPDASKPLRGFLEALNG